MSLPADWPQWKSGRKQFAITEQGRNTAQEYAKQFPKRKPRSPGYAVVIVGAVMAIIYAAVAMLLLPFLRIDVRDLVGPISFGPGWC